MTSRTAEQRWLAWQTVDTGRLFLLSATSLLVVVALARTVTAPPFHGRDVAIAFGLYIAFGELLRLALPGGREAAPIAMSAAMSYAMVLRIAGQPPHYQVTGGAFQVVIVAAGGTSRQAVGPGSPACRGVSWRSPASRSSSARSAGT
jgi:hypothetical protein